MILLEEIDICEEADYDELLKISRIDYLLDAETVDILKQHLGTKIRKILVEYPYYDNEYLSNYYSHYSQKFRHYSKMCCRLHFEKDDDYVGFVTLRPTPGGTKIGKTYLAPELFINGRAYLLRSTFHAHVLGQKLEIDCFPWKKQEYDISCCAHTATWTILKYYGNKYKNHSDTTIGEVVEKVKNDWGRKTPTMGLDPVQVSDVLKEYGFSPLIIGKGSTGEKPIDELLAYIESGLPVVAFLNMAPQSHAVAIIGHGEIDEGMIDDSLVDKESGVILSTKLISSVYAMDDRIFPYVEVTKGLPDKYSDVSYGLPQIDYAVIPLHSRMQLSYKEIYNRMIVWVKGAELDFGEKPICRIYITSSVSLKEKAFDNRSMNDNIKDIILSLSMPKFVWCIDFANVDAYCKRKTTGRIIVDSTSATLEDEPWIFRHDASIIQFRDYDDNRKIYEIRERISPYDMYVNNLECVEGCYE